MTFANLVITDDAAIRTITVHRPDKLNALNQATIAELAAAFAAAKHDDAVRVVILTGAGTKAFVAGADIAELAEASPADALAFSRAGQRMMADVERLGKPVIAMVHGFALGGGLELAMCAHLRVASEQARFGLPEINLGLLPGFGGTQRLLRLAGRAATLELALTGEMIDAARAQALGLVHRVVPADQLAVQTRELAARLAASAPHALRGILDAVLIGGEAGIDVGLEFESRAFAVCTATADMREGTRAFLEKRKPQFSGR